MKQIGWVILAWLILQSPTHAVEANGTDVTINYVCDSKAQILYLGDATAIPPEVDHKLVETISVKYVSKSGMDLTLRPDLDFEATPVKRTCHLLSGSYEVNISAGHVRYEGTLLVAQPTIRISKGKILIQDYSTVGGREYLGEPDNKGCAVGWAVSYTLNGKTGKLSCER